MRRGASLVPQRGGGTTKEDIPQQLKLSLFEYPVDLAEYEAAAAAYNAGGGGGGGTHQGEDPHSPASPLKAGGAASGMYSGGPDGGGGKKKAPRPPAAQVRVFDSDGNLTTRQTGVHVFHMRREALFFVLRSLSWAKLLSISMALYVLILTVISLCYYFWGWYCGGGVTTTTLINSFYFTVVSLAANGGYMGEGEVMVDPLHRCYSGRTFIVMCCSYANIVFVGLVAALVVGKAEYTGSLANRIEFSDFCTLSRIPGRLGSWRLSFRMSNLENRKPLAHGNLRLFVVSAEPLKEYKIQKRERKQLLRRLNAIEWETQEYLQSRAAAAAASTLQQQQPLPAEMLASKKQTSSGPPAVASASALMDDPHLRAIAVHKHRLEQEKAQEREMRRAERRVGRRERQRQEREANTAKDSDDEDDGNSAGGGGGADGNNEDGKGETAVPVSAKPKTNRRKQQLRGRQRGSRKGGSRSASSTPTSSMSSSSSSSSSSLANYSSKTNSSVSGRENSTNYNEATAGPLSPHHHHHHHTDRHGSRSPVAAAGHPAALSPPPPGTTAGGTGGSYGTAGGAPPPPPPFSSPVRKSTGALGKPTTLNERSRLLGGSDKHTGTRAKKAAAAAASGSYTTSEGDDDDDGEYLERVHINVSELSWQAPGESYLAKGSGQLSLWYPVNIHHTIDERSPLFRFMEVPRVGAALGLMANNSNKQQQQQIKSGLSSRQFQIVAVFDATEMETGATIMAKHTYAATDIVTHYKFSNKLVHMNPESGEVLLDYHYFNELLPIKAVESSTTDSEQ